jgi:hypothetical protein
VDLGSSDEVQSLFRELWVGDGEDQIALRGEERYVPRVVRCSSEAVEERQNTVSTDEPFRLEVSKPGILDEMTLRETDRKEPGPGEVEIRVRAVGLGTAPKMDMELNMVPVDYLSRAIVRLSLREESLGRRFHLANPHPVSVNDLVAWIEAFGYPLERVPYDKWRSDLVNPTKGLRQDALYSMAPLLSMSAAADGPALVDKVPEFDCRNTTEALSDTEISCPQVDGELMENYLVNLVRRGFLHSPTGG